MRFLLSAKFAAHKSKCNAFRLKGKAIRRRKLALYLMAPLMLAAITFSFYSLQIYPAQAQSTAQSPAGTQAQSTAQVQNPAQEQGQDPASYYPTETDTAQDIEDQARVEKFKQFVPENLRRWLPEVRKRAHRHTPVLSYKHWSNEPKRFVPTLLFCLFTGLTGSAFFSRQIFVAQDCCKSQFWSCLAKASLSGITVLISVIVLDRLGITGSLATLLLAVLELVVVAGLSVGVSLIGERIFEKTGLVNLEYLKSHPRLATFMKIFIGSVIIALIVQIPGLGKLPRIGIRIATLIAVLGAGGLLKTKFGTQPIS